MRSVEASAPGKFVLCGEYVVLDGAPAVAVAVDYRARVRLRMHTGGDAHTLSCPGFADGDIHFRVSAGGEFIWDEARLPADSMPFLQQVWRSFGPAVSGTLDIRLDTTELVDMASGRKFGLGSSAALTVAMKAAFAAFCEVPADLVSTAELHRQAQGGNGSGIDVAAAWAGGTIEYHGGGRYRELAWPDGLHFAVLWSGQAASTTARLQRFSGTDKNSPSRVRLAEASHAVVNAWPQGSVSDLLRYLRDYVVALQQFDEELGLGIMQGGHAGLVAAAPEHDVVYKPCGAGGGDVGVVLASTAEQVRQFVRLAGDNGFRALGLQIDEQGVTAGVLKQ